jgi:hypothetical protein
MGRAETAPLVIKGATLLDAHSGRQIGNSAILVEKDRVREVGDANTRLLLNVTSIRGHKILAQYSANALSG